jgi:uncharacterized protein (UPF0128 family)
MIFTPVNLILLPDVNFGCQSLLRLYFNIFVNNFNNIFDSFITNGKKYVTIKKIKHIPNNKEKMIVIIQIMRLSV